MNYISSVNKQCVTLIVLIKLFEKVRMLWSIDVDVQPHSSQCSGDRDES